MNGLLSSPSDLQYRTVTRPPKHLYKMRSLAGDGKLYSSEIILESKLHWAAPATFNDPFDCQPAVVFTGSRLRQEAYFRDLVHKYAPAAPRHIRRGMNRDARAKAHSAIEDGLSLLHAKVRHEIGVCSLTTKPDDIVMWSHYADSHRGIALRFRTDFNLRDFAFAFEVQYSKDRPLLDIIEKNRASMFLRVLLTKAEHWQYENEWRLVDVLQAPGPRAFPPRCLDAVILGALISRNDEKSVREWVSAAERPIELLRAVADPRDFSLMLVPA